MPIQEVNRKTTAKTTTKKTVAYGAAAKASAKPATSHSNKIISGTDVLTCPYCGQSMRR